VNTRFPNRLARSAFAGYLMAEALVYISVVVVLLGAGYVAMYKCVNNAVVLRRTADDISAAIHAGERWRADVRAAAGQVRWEQEGEQSVLILAGPRGESAWRSDRGKVFRRLKTGPWVAVVQNVISSSMQADPRQEVTAWRWELELKPRSKVHHMLPLFTFVAVPQKQTTP
jgi:hypothetical protein